MNKRTVIWGFGRVFHHYENSMDLTDVIAIVDNRISQTENEYNGIPIIAQENLGLFDYDQIVVFSDNMRDEIYQILTTELKVDASVILPYQSFVFIDKESKKYMCEASYKHLYKLFWLLPVAKIEDKANSLTKYEDYEEILKALRARFYQDYQPDLPYFDVNYQEEDNNLNLDLFLDSFESMSYEEIKEKISLGKNRYVAINLPIVFGEYDDSIFCDIKIIKDESDLFGRYVLLDRGLTLSEAEDNKSLSVYVVCHKKVNEICKKGYKYIQAGTELNGDIGYICDNTGDNISHLNRHINECTALYWMWKNDDSDYVGLNHYRRFFQGENPNEPISERQIKALLRDYDIILPVWNSYPRTTMVHMMMTTDNEAVDEGYQIVRDILCEKYPDYIEAFDQTMEQFWFFPCNMFVTRKEIFNDYCTWLFDIIIDACSKIDITKYDDYSCRIVGFMAERMLTVWLLNHSYKIKAFPILQLD